MCIRDSLEQRRAAGEAVANSREAYPHACIRDRSRTTARIVAPASGVTYAVPSCDPTTVTPRGPSGVVTQLLPAADTGPSCVTTPDGQMCIRDSHVVASFIRAAEAKQNPPTTAQELASKMAGAGAPRFAERVRPHLARPSLSGP